jgi:hypothetical protein
VAVGDAITGADAIGAVADGNPATGADAAGAVAVGEEQLELELTQQKLKVQRQRLRQIKRSSMISGRSILTMMALTVFIA